MEPSELTIAKLIETLMDNYDLSERVVGYNIVMDGKSILSVPVQLRPTNEPA